MDGLLRLTARERTVLAALTAEVGHLVPVERIIDATWNKQPPHSVRNRVHTLISSLRRQMGAGTIVTRPAGYVLTLDDQPDALDATHFESLVARGRSLMAAQDHAGAAELYAAALALWRGSAYEDVQSPHLLAEATRLAELRRTVTEDYVAAQLGRGAHAEVLIELTGMVTQDPLHERLRGQLMLALYRCGRQADALEVFENGARLLAEEYGLDPGEDLRTLRQAILQDDPSLAVPAKPSATPSQLPAGIGDFVGREPELAELSSLLADAAPGHCAVVSIAGMGGVGKTTLAIHAAHQSRVSYPDGCLYADMQGKDTFTVLGSFLRAYGQPSDKLPDEPDERAALLRSTLAGRRVLVVLDNVLDERQVRPLIPGGGCGVLLTSRRPLTGISGVHLLSLDVLGTQESLRLLANVAGEDRVGGDPAAALKMIDLCGRLPLAIRIAGVRMAQHRALSAARLAERLAQQRQRLDEFIAADLDVRACLAESWQRLDTMPAALLEKLSQLPIRSYTPWLSAGLLDVSPSEAHRCLDQLEAAQLVRSADGEHYQMHDLVRLFALEQICLPTSVIPAYEALLAHAESAAGQLPCRVIPVGPAEKPVEPIADAARWFDDERENLVLAAEHCAELGNYPLATRLATALANSCIVSGAHDDWERSHRPLLAALQRPGALRPADEARLRVSYGSLLRLRNQPRPAIVQLRLAYREARRCGDDLSAICACLSWSVCARMLGRQQVAHATIGKAFSLLSELPEETVLSGYAWLGFGILEANHQPYADEGVAAMRRALQIFDHFGERWAAASAHAALGGMLSRRREEGAISHLRTAIALQAEIGDRNLLARAELQLANANLLQGRHDLARPVLERTLQVFRELRDGWGIGTSLRLLGRSYLRDGEPGTGRDLLESAVAELRATDQPYPLAQALHLLAEARLACGEATSARFLAAEALEIFQNLGAVEADRVAIWLSALDA